MIGAGVSAGTGVIHHCDLNDLSRAAVEPKSNNRSCNHRIPSGFTAGSRQSLPSRTPPSLRGNLESGSSIFVRSSQFDARCMLTSRPPPPHYAPWIRNRGIQPKRRMISLLSAHRRLDGENNYQPLPGQYARVFKIKKKNICLYDRLPRRVNKHDVSSVNRPAFIPSVHKADVMFAYSATDWINVPSTLN